MGYSVSTWIQVAPIEVSTDASEAQRIAPIDEWLDQQFEDYKFNGSVLIIVSDELLGEAFKRPRLNDGTKSNHGFGWVIERNHSWHNGAWLGASTYIARYPKSRSCLVVLDNSSSLRIDTLAEEIERAMKPIFHLE